MKKIRVRSLASGDSLSTTVFDYKGTRAGAPSAYLQSAMHGSEVQGSLVIALLVEYFEKHPPLGNVRLVPNCNPQGLNEKGAEYTLGRFDLSTGDNFNRQYFLPCRSLNWKAFQEKFSQEPEDKIFAAFRAILRKAIRKRLKSGLSYADRLSLVLQSLSIDFDHCLDLHCANVSVRHVYAPAYAAEDAAYLGIRHHILMPNKFGGAMDEVFFSPWWTLSEKLGTAIPVQSFTVELGSHETVSRVEAARDRDGILSYLRHRGVIAGKGKKIRAIRCAQENYKLVHAPVGGIAEFLVKPGARVKKGELLAKILVYRNRPLFVEVRSPFAGVITLHHSSSVVNEGAELYKMFTEV